MTDPAKSVPPPAYYGAGEPSGAPPQYQQQPAPQAQPQHGQPAAQPQYAQPAAQPQYAQPAGQPQYAQPYQAQIAQPGYPATQQLGNQQTMVVVQQPGFIQGPSYGPSPTSLNCPHCSASVTTSTSKECGGMVWMVAGIICLVGLFFPLVWLGCCLIPFCIPSLYNTRHNCPNCQRVLGTYQQGGM